MQHTTAPNRAWLLWLAPLILWVACLGLLGAADLACRGKNIWEGFRESAAFRKPKYAETIHPADMFRTRANTWSNMAYALVGFQAIALGLADWRTRQRPEDQPRRLWNEPAAGTLLPSMSLAYGLACCFLAVGSGLFHASLTRWGQQLDVASMYSPLIVLIAIGFARRIPVAGGIPTWPPLLAAAVLATAVLYVFKWSVSSAAVMPILIGGVTASVVLNLFFQSLPAVGGGWLALAIASLAAATACRELDIAGSFAPPGSPLQGHAFWHVLTAVSLAAMAGYHQSWQSTGSPSHMSRAQIDASAQAERVVVGGSR